MDGCDKSNFPAIRSDGMGAERNPANFRRSDDAVHPDGAEDYYEWWYFDASFQNGYHIVVTFHYRNIFLRPMMPTIQFMIYRPDGSQVVRYAACSEDEIYAGREYCDVRMGGSWARDTGESYEISMAIKDSSVRLVFKPMVPGWKPGTGFLYHNEKEGKISGWVVPVPHGEVEGELRIGDEIIPVKGTGYHDHNWGNYRFHETFHSWYWGRIHNEKYTVVYGWVIPQDKNAPVVSPLLIARNGEIVLSTDLLQARLEDPVEDDRTKKEYAGSLTLACETEGVSFLLDVKTKRVIEFMRLPRAMPWDQFYYRFLADYRMTIGIDGRTDVAAGEFLHEMMIL